MDFSTTDPDRPKVSQLRRWLDSGSATYIDDCLEKLWRFMVWQDPIGAVHVEVMNTETVLELVGKPEIAALAKDLRERLDGMPGSV
jgi:hypothetical protein